MKPLPVDEPERQYKGREEIAKMTVNTYTKALKFEQGLIIFYEEEDDQGFVISLEVVTQGVYGFPDDAILQPPYMDLEDNLEELIYDESRWLRNLYKDNFNECDPGVERVVNAVLVVRRWLRKVFKREQR